MLQGTIIGIILALYALAKIYHGKEKGAYSESYGIISVIVASVIYVLTCEYVITEWSINNRIVLFVAIYIVAAFVLRLMFINLKYKAEFAVTTSDSIIGAIFGLITGAINVYAFLSCIYVWAEYDEGITQIVNAMAGTITYNMITNNPVIGLVYSL